MSHRLKPVLPIHTGTYDQQTLRRTPGNDMDTSLESPLERILQNSIETSSPFTSSDRIDFLKDWNQGANRQEPKNVKLMKEEET